MYQLNLELYRSLPSCVRYAATRIDGVMHYHVQSKLQMACVGSFELADPEGGFLPGPVGDIATIAPEEFMEISCLNDSGHFELADRKMLNLALELGIVQYTDETLTLSRELKTIA